MTGRIDPSLLVEVRLARLAALGVTVEQVSHLSPAKVGQWSRATSTLSLRRQAPIQAKTWVLEQLLAKLLDPEAPCKGRPVPQLRVAR